MLQLNQNGKGANESALRVYFQKVQKLQLSGEKFPVDLDEVWPLAYSQKVKAMEVLQREFVEDEEFNLSQKGKVVKFNELQNGVKIKAKLSVSALEFLIARKVRPVFEVYRRVFHSINEPINGVMPMYHSGVLGYPRKEYLISVERSHKNGYRLAKKFPKECFYIGRTACISATLAKVLLHEYEGKQLQLDLFTSNQLPS